MLINSRIDPLVSGSKLRTAKRQCTFPTPISHLAEGWKPYWISFGSIRNRPTHNTMERGFDGDFPLFVWIQVLLHDASKALFMRQIDSLWLEQMVGKQKSTIQNRTIAHDTIRRLLNFWRSVTISERRQDRYMTQRRNIPHELTESPSELRKTALVVIVIGCETLKVSVILRRYSWIVPRSSLWLFGTGMVLFICEGFIFGILLCSCWFITRLGTWLLLWFSAILEPTNRSSPPPAKREISTFRFTQWMILLGDRFDYWKARINDYFIIPEKHTILTAKQNQILPMNKAIFASKRGMEVDRIHHCVNIEKYTCFHSLLKHIPHYNHSRRWAAH